MPIEHLLRIVKGLGSLAFTYRIVLRTADIADLEENLLKQHRILEEQLEAARADGLLTKEGQGTQARWTLTYEGNLLCP